MNSSVIVLARRFALGAALATVGLALSNNPLCYGQSKQQTESQAAAQANVPQPNWIWAPIKREPNRAAGICYFRKAFVLRTEGRGHIKIACDDQFIVYVNGVKVATGTNEAV